MARALQVRQEDELVVQKLKGSKLSFEPWLSSLISQRLDEEDDVELYDSCLVSDLEKSGNLANIKQAALLIKDVIDNDKTLFVCYDFDADGISSLSIVRNAFLRLGYTNFKFDCPERATENHGLNMRIIEAAKQAGTSLLMTVDNGSSNKVEIAAAKAAGMTVLITDHHDVPENDLGADCVVNPKHPDDTFGDETFCGAGIAFLLMLELGRIMGKDVGESALIQFCAIGTMADVVPLKKNNRILVRAGLEAMKNEPIPFIREALTFFKMGPKQIDSDFLGWKIAPMLNAAGRIEKPIYASEGLLASGGRAKKAVEYLNGVNIHRREMLADALIEEDFDFHFISEQLEIICNEYWHCGLVGLLAGRKAQALNKVVGCGFKGVDGNWRVSFRAPKNGAALGEVMIKAHKEGLILGGGGHQCAAGMSLSESMLEPTFDFMCGNLQSMDHTRYFDADMSPVDWSIEKVESMVSIMQPFGNEHPKPLFTGVGIIDRVDILKGLHLKLMIDGVQAIGFNLVEKMDYDLFPGDEIVFTYEPSINEWNNRKTVQMMLHSIG